MSGSAPEPPPREPREVPEEPAPGFGRWAVWYLLVALDLALVIAACAWITRLGR